jgi:hypothetical protein
MHTEPVMIVVNTLRLVGGAETQALLLAKALILCMLTVLSCQWH